MPFVSMQLCHLNTVHKRIRTRVEHALAYMKAWNILRNC